jgi:hypothetical protein
MKYRGIMSKMLDTMQMKHESKIATDSHPGVSGRRPDQLAIASLIL